MFNPIQSFGEMTTKPYFPLSSLIAGLLFVLLSGCSTPPQQSSPWGMPTFPQQWSSPVDSQAFQHEPEFMDTSEPPTLSAEEHEQFLPYYHPPLLKVG